MNQEEVSQAKEPPDELSIEEGFEIDIFDKNKNIKTSDFTCGVEGLNTYVRQQLSQDVKRGLAVCYCVQKNNSLIGFYTLSSSTVEASQYLTIKKGVGRYLPVPVTLIGRLAVDVDSQGNDLGGMLILDAIKRSIASSKHVASKSLIVDAINDNAVKFYEKFGFVLIPDSMKMLLTMEEAEGLI